MSACVEVWMTCSYTVVSVFFQGACAIFVIKQLCVTVCVCVCVCECVVDELTRPCVCVCVCVCVCEEL